MKGRGIYKNARLTITTPGGVLVSVSMGSLLAMMQYNGQPITKGCKHSWGFRDGYSVAVEFPPQPEPKA